MPRNGSGVYSHPFPDVVEGTTIESAVFNGNTSDVEQDLNTPRPIVAGGTGANNAHDAMIALSGEIAKQVVTNYDTFPFVNGSFTSEAGATSAPGGSYYYGTYYAQQNPDFATIEAWEVGGSNHYVRHKSSAVWGAWKLQPGSTADLDAAYVNVAGDTMTGALSIGGTATIYASGGQPSLTFNQSTAAATKQRMGLLYDGGGALTDPGIVIQSLTDAGGFAGNSGAIWRDGALSLGGIGRPNGGAGGLVVGSSAAATSPTTGALTVAGGVGVAGNMKIAGGLNAGNVPAALAYAHVLRLSTDLNLCLTGDAGAIGLVGLNDANNAYVPIKISANTASTSPTTGALTVAGGVGIGGSIQSGGSIRNTGNIGADGIITAGNTSASGYYYFGNTGTKYLSYDGTNFSLAGGNLTVLGVNVGVNGMASTGPVSVANLTSNGDITALHGNVYLQSSAAGANLPPGGYAMSMVYGGATQFGTLMRCVNDSAGYLAIAFQNSGAAAIGSISCTVGATAFNTSSSAELKEDLKTFDAGNIIDNTNVYDFKWKSHDERGYGVLAQQAVEVYPTAVTHTINPETKDEFWGVDYSKYVPVLLQELKALRARVFELESRVGVGITPA